MYLWKHQKELLSCSINPLPSTPASVANVTPLLHKVKIECVEPVVIGLSDDSDKDVQSEQPSLRSTEISSTRSSVHSINTFQRITSDAIPPLYPTSFGVDFRSSSVQVQTNQPPTHPCPERSVEKDCTSIVHCLRELKNHHGAKSPLSRINYDSIKILMVDSLPPEFDGDIILELPALGKQALASWAGQMQGMDK